MVDYKNYYKGSFYKTKEEKLAAMRTAIAVLDAKLNEIKEDYAKAEKMPDVRSRYYEKDFDEYVWIVTADGKIESIPYSSAKIDNFDFESRRAFLSRQDAEEFLKRTQVIADSMFFRRVNDRKYYENNYKITSAYVTNPPIYFSSEDMVRDYYAWLNHNHK